jgi:hypothetical protein
MVAVHEQVLTGKRLMRWMGAAFRARWNVGFCEGLSVGLPPLAGVAAGRPSWGAVAPMGGFARFYAPRTHRIATGSSCPRGSVRRWP